VGPLGSPSRGSLLARPYLSQGLLRPHLKGILPKGTRELGPRGGNSDQTGGGDTEQPDAMERMLNCESQVWLLV
jgi:hypothetical protein